MIHFIAWDGAAFCKLLPPELLPRGCQHYHQPSSPIPGLDERNPLYLC